jgi:hypothetical protein
MRQPYLAVLTNGACMPENNYEISRENQQTYTPRKEGASRAAEDRHVW